MSVPTRQRAGQFVDRTARSSVRWGLRHALTRTLFDAAAAKGDLHGLLVQAADRHDDQALAHVLDQLRAAGPVYRGRYALVTVDLEICREVLTSSDFRAGLPVPERGPIGALSRWAQSPYTAGPLRPPSLLVSEPPDHTRYRRLVSRVFTARAVEKLRARTEQIATDLIAAMDPRRPVDLVEAYASLLPVTVIAEILGVPPEQRSQVLAFGAGTAPSLDIGMAWRDHRRVETTLREFDLWLSGHIERLRREPGTDLLSQLTRVHDDEGGLTTLELKSIAGLLLVAGFETTANLLGNGIALLWQHPDQSARLRDDPDLWPHAVDEILRLDPPVLLTARQAVRATTLAGQQVAAEAPVVTVLAGANRDPGVFADPLSFDVGRANARDHLSFGAGRHFCLGASLARMEGVVGLRTLATAYPDLQLLPGSERRSTRILRGYAHLPARLAP